MSDSVFKGKRAPVSILYMLIVTVAILVYWQNPAGKPMIDSICLITIGFFIYGPVMLIGVHALDLVPKNAAGTSAGLTGLFGYFLGTALLANIVAGYIIDAYSWNGFFIFMLGACGLSILLLAFTWKSE
jgi:OPA family glycerol-3-phosphate transporter-like MFS transporter